MALATESRTGGLRACVQEHVDVTLTEVGDQVRSPRHRAMRLAAARIDAYELSR